MRNDGRSTAAGRLGIMLAAALSVTCQPESSSTTGLPGATLALTTLFTQGNTEGYARATEPRTFVFPADHGAHPDFRNEWWYLTGNLTSADGHQFGYQFTLFRRAITPDDPDRQSDWATRQLYMAHFALTDVRGKTFHAFERLSRGAVGLAGVETRPFRGWVDDWELAGEDPPPFRLSAGNNTIGVELELTSAKSTVLQGDRGLSRKGREPGSSSYYYSMTRMPTRGVVVSGLKTYAVQGSSWLDREWSSGVLEPSQTGWDWFALQLSDGRDLMLYQLRLEDGAVDPLSSGTVVALDGTSKQLGSSHFSIETLDWWISPATRVRYPAAWKILVPSEQIELTVTPRLADQELSLSVRYWEGAVQIYGSSKKRAITGDGYVELTGYGDPPREKPAD